MPFLPWANPTRLLDLGVNNAEARAFVGHNLRHLRLVHGGHALAAANAISFDPRKDYWYRPGRRAAVWYLAHRANGAFGPAASMREVALQVATALDRVVPNDEPFDNVAAYHPQWASIVKRIREEQLPRLRTSSAWDALTAPRRGAWPKTLRQDLDDFLQTTLAGDSIAQGEPALRHRFPWFAYLGADAESIETRRAYFFGWSNLFCATNAYRFAGAQSFGPVLQNTPSNDLLAIVDRWFNNEPPRDVGFSCLGSTDDVRSDRINYSTVSELWGLVRLNSVPYVNGINRDYFLALATAGNMPASKPFDAYGLATFLGSSVAEALTKDAALVPRAAAYFDDMMRMPLREPVVPFETLSNSRIAKRIGQDPTHLADHQLLAQIDSLASKRLKAWSPEDKARAALHLLLDATINAGLVEEDPPISTKQSKSNSPADDDPDEAFTLPQGLVEHAQRALSYLDAGMHVLLAGAPGTGKTQIAQFVAATWNDRSDTLKRKLHPAQAPRPIVANSAWSPFHTIGGLVPDGEGRFRPTPGAFIDRAQASTDTWSLVDRALVLDEMNRADLDRSIGDLYPLLSGTVTSVEPTGLPGVKVIRRPKRFRIIATVNDATIDDVVFPMSHGLARRFVRIELEGASEQDVLQFLQSVPNPSESRLSAAQAAVEALFVEATEQRLVKADGRLPFGAGWFGLLGRWVEGSLKSTGEAEIADENPAMTILIAGLRSAIRYDQLARVLARLEHPEPTT